jgi:hypothetical protein
MEKKSNESSLQETPLNTFQIHTVNKSIELLLPISPEIQKDDTKLNFKEFYSFATFKEFYQNIKHLSNKLNSKEAQLNECHQVLNNL